MDNTIVYEFESSKYSEYKSEVWHKSNNLIEKIIKEKSIIQIGEDVETIYAGKNTFLRVTTIKLMAVSRFSERGHKLSFYYEGIRLAKNGEPMKNRKPEWFGTFIKNGQIYHCPSSLRLEVLPISF